jgi:outer membrane protein assembly factor BamB
VSKESEVIRKATPRTHTVTAYLIAIAALLCGGVASAAMPEGDAPPAEETVAPVQATATMIGYSGDAAYYWPRWRGPSGQGIVSDDYDYPQQWSAQTNILWKVKVPGRDSASPIVWGDKIFLVTADTTGDARTRSILGFSTTDGKLLWRTEAPAPDYQPNRRRTDRSIATPATDGERVYAHLGAHGLMAVDFEGNQVWHRKMGTFDHATSSPLIIGKRLVVVQVLSQRKGSVVYAYDPTNGHMKWHAKRPEMFASGTPVGIQFGEQQQVVVSAQQYVRAYDSISGDEIWRVLGTKQNTIPTPVVGFGMVFATSGPRGDILAIHPNGTGNVTRTHVAWKVEETGPLLPSPLFHDGYLFVLDDALGTLTCFDGATGEVIWSELIIDTRSGGLTASPVLLDGKIFVTDVLGNTHIFAAGAEFKFLGTNRLGEEVRASPALSEGVWYFRTKRHLIAIATP